MKWVCVAAGLTFAVAACGDEKPKKELEPFQGTWAVVSITSNGAALPDDEVKKLTLVVKENERVISAGDKVVSKATFTFDATKNPKTMDIVVSDGKLAGKTVRGIYELKDGTLTICVALEGDKRPDDFTAKEGSERLLQVFKKRDAKNDPAKPN